MTAGRPAPATELASRYIFDVDPDSFPALVRENSYKGLVLVFWWSPWARPCNMLLPRLVKIADEYGGRFVLALLNTDYHGELARAQGIRGIPTVTFHRNGQTVETVRGTWSLKAFRATVDRHLPPGHGANHHAALSAFREGMAQQAFEMLEPAPGCDVLRARIDQVRVSLHEGRFADALERIERLDRSLPDIDELRHLSTHLRIIAVAGLAEPETSLRGRLAADPGESRTRYQLAALCLVTDRNDEALDLLESLRDDNNAEDEWRRQAMRAVDAITAGDPADVAAPPRET